MTTRSNSKSLHRPPYSLALCAALCALTGCPADEPDNVEVDDIVGVGARGTFSRQSGTLAVSVAPKDAEGNFIGHDLPRSAFAFADVQMFPGMPTSGATGGIAVNGIAVKTQVSAVSVSEPDSDAQLTGVVIFDSSGSMAQNDPAAVGRKAGGEAMFDILREGDQVAVLDFGAGATPPFKVSRVLQDFTDDRALLSASLVKLTQTGGTPLWASVLEGLTLLDPKQNPDVEEPALVVLTDGQADSGSMVAPVIAEAQRLSVPVFAIGLGKSLDYRDLSRVTSETGGVMVEAADAKALEQAFAGISSGVRLGTVTVEGQGSYLLPAGVTRVTVKGTLVTTDKSGSRFETPFSFTTEIE